VTELKLQAISRLPATTKLDLGIVLPLRNKDRLTKLLQEIYDPASPNYGKYLSPEKFTEMFGPTERDYQALSKFAERNGLKVTAMHSNRALLNVSGSVADIEKVFHVTMRAYQHPTEARTFHAPDVEPTIDLDVPILAIQGLDDFIIPRPAIRVGARRDAALQPAVGSGPCGNYGGNDFRNAYAPGVTLNGSGQSVGIYNPHHGFLTNDVVIYQNQFGLPHVPVTNIVVTGSPGVPDSFTIEVILDLEMVAAMAPGLSKAIVYEDESQYTAFNRMAIDNTAKQLSCSWIPPIEGASADQVYQQFVAQGQTFFCASGDDGAYYPTVPQHATDQYITVVGGTVLTMSGTGAAWASETAWIGGGGGIFTNTASPYLIPSWQQGIDMSSNYGSTAYRNSPDVAAVASDIYIVLNGSGGCGVGGTSAASPLWAGFMALVNQQRAQMGRSSAGFINPSLYAIGKGAVYTSAFHDITTGNNLTGWNTQPNHDHEYFAQAGYDLCSGWGTPAGQNLINDLAGLVGAVWVDFNYTGSTQDGNYDTPFKTLSAGVTAVPSNGTIAIKTAGSSSQTMTISKPMTVMAVGGPATIGQ
jgi:subtilase family serine protease